MPTRAAFTCSHHSYPVSLPGVYQGIVPTLWRDVPSNALYFLAYEGVKRAMAKGDPSQLRTSQVCRGVLFVW